MSSIVHIYRRFPTPESCIAHLEPVRWGESPGNCYEFTMSLQLDVSHCPPQSPGGQDEAPINGVSIAKGMIFMTNTMNKDFELVTGTKKIDYQGTDCYLPVLIVKTKLPDAKNRTIKMVHISTGNPLVFRKDALKYANIWRNESLQVGYITHF